MSKEYKIQSMYTNRTIDCMEFLKLPELPSHAGPEIEEIELTVVDVFSEKHNLFIAKGTYKVHKFIPNNFPYATDMMIQIFSTEPYWSYYIEPCIEGSYLKNDSNSFRVMFNGVGDCPSVKIGQKYEFKRNGKTIW